MATLQASPAGLSQIKQHRKSSGRAIEDPHWLIQTSHLLDAATDWSAAALVGKGIFASGVSLSTWKRFLRGEPINSRVFKAFCQVLDLNDADLVATGSNAVLTSAPYQDWGVAPDVPVFFGREAELATLEAWIVGDRCRLVAILGMGGAGKTQLSMRLGSGGMGKTDLSVKLAQGIQSDFAYVIWRSLLNAPPLTEILSDWIRFLSDQQESQLPESLDACLTKLLHLLKSQRCLLILDNVETILCPDRPGHYRPGYEGYGQLLQRLGEVAHQSCVLLTSREKPKEVAYLEGPNRPVRSLELSGLDIVNGQRIFAEIGEFRGTEAEWQILIEYYGGNPLALKLTAKQIADVFNGDIANFLAAGTPVIYDLRSLLDWHFARLSDAEQEILYWLAINREPVSAIDLQTDVAPVTRPLVAATLQLLQRRLPLERIQERFTLQPVLLEDVTDRLIQQCHREILAGDLQVLRQYALLKATAKDYLRQSQRQLIMLPLLQRLQQQLGEALEPHLHSLIGQLQGQSIASTGYAGGNLLNLLVSLRPDLSGCDFSQLAVVQADLTGVILHRTNWQQAIVDRCTFTEAIGSIVALAFSPDGQWLATGEPNGDVRLWNLVTAHQSAAWRGHANWVGCVAFSPDSKTLASSGFDQALRLWTVPQVANGQAPSRRQTLVGHQDWIRKMVFAPDGQTIVSSSDDKTIRVWDVNTAACWQTLSGHTGLIWSIALSPDGRQLASSSFDGTVRLWDLTSGTCRHVLTEHTQVVAAVAFSLDGQTVISGSRDQTLKVWDVQSGRCLQTLPAAFGNIQALAFNPQRTIAVTGGIDRCLRVWDVATGTCLKTLPGHSGEIWSLAFEPSGKMFASGSDDQSIRLWDISSGRNVRTLQGFKDGVHTLTAVPHQPQIVSGHYDWMIRLWDVATGKCLRTLCGHKGRIWNVVCDRTGNLIASASSDHTVRLWHLHTGACLHILHDHDNWVWSVAFSPDGKLLASGDENHLIRLWDVATGELLNTIAGHRGRVWTLSFSPDGKLLAAGSHDQTVKLWDVERRTCMATFPTNETQKIWSARFSPDGRTIVCSSSDHTLSLWDVSTQQCLRIFTGHTGLVWRVSFSPDGQQLVSSSDDRTIRLWDIQTGTCLRVFSEHTNSVVEAVFAAEQTLCSGSLDGTLRFWNLAMGECVQTLSSPRPYEGMDIREIQGLTSAEQATLKALGAIVPARQCVLNPIDC
jgi:WD40 repeat protein